ncbi:hypothetical protein AXF42_Ash010592 [Apostasia shenzhenica]|uniref:Uncharacterized protein n=1 Tax=Apostasia shenzhenica TaxID=1088818 RepID=A0A2I0A6I6_9ASPA|nr:hypothetical protein AXF42_Ash010592 [Apostasia shenzhenica]
MASTGATHRHLQLLVLLLICAFTSTTAAPIKFPFYLPNDSEWHSMLDTPVKKDVAIRYCKEGVEAYNSENPKGWLNGCRSVYIADAKLLLGERLIELHLQFESSQSPSWFGNNIRVVADMFVTISLSDQLYHGRFQAWVDSVAMLSVQPDHGL